VLVAEKNGIIYLNGMKRITPAELRLVKAMTLPVSVDIKY